MNMTGMVSRQLKRKPRLGGVIAIAMVSAALLVCGCSSLGWFGSNAKPRLRVGIMSDTQSLPGKTTNRGQLAMKKAMEQLKEMGVDVLIVAGDISNNGNKKVYEEYREIVDEVYGEKKPEQFAIMGNHDYWNGMNAADAQKNFCEGMKVDSVYKHKVVGGYDFIAVSPDNGSCTAGAFGKEASDYMKREVAKAVKRNPDKPVFVITHQHAYDTVYGSMGWGNKDLSEMLAPYENVLLFSGHSHYPIDDERSINQKNFSAIGTASLAYCEMEPGYANGSVPPNGSACRHYLLMEVYRDRLVVKRFDIATGEEIKPDARWVLPLPLKKERFSYTDKRAESRKAPAFPAGAKATVAFPEKKPFERFRLSFTAAQHDDFVHSYLVKVSMKQKDGTWKQVKEYKFFSDFYLGIKTMANPYSVQVPAKDLEAGQAYKLDVFPVESFGKTGEKPVSVEFKMPVNKAPAK